MAENTQKTKPKVTVKVDLKKLFAEFQKSLKEVYGEGCVERTKGVETRKGYDTTGYGYQFVVNRFNEVCSEFGIVWDVEDETKVVREYPTKSGAKWFEAVSRVSILLINIERNLITRRPCYGGHKAPSQGDALKGAYTNAFKKTAALFGVGADAYEGTIDEDSKSIEEEATAPKTNVAQPNLPSLTPEQLKRIEKEVTAIENAETKKQLQAIGEQVTALVGTEVGGLEINFLRKLIEAKARTI